MEFQSRYNQFQGLTRKMKAKKKNTYLRLKERFRITSRKIWSSSRISGICRRNILMSSRELWKFSKQIHILERLKYIGNKLNRVQNFLNLFPILFFINLWGEIISIKGFWTYLQQGIWKKIWTWGENEKGKKRHLIAKFKINPSVSL